MEFIVSAIGMENIYYMKKIFNFSLKFIDISL